MSDEFDWEGFVRTMAEVMDVTIAAAWLPTVVANLKATAALADLVLSFPLPDSVDPAPVFEA